MIYSINYDYLKQKDFSAFKKTILVTAKTISRWCEYYKARLLTPKRGIKEKTKQGKIPLNKKKREFFIENLVNWIFKNSTHKDLFALFLDQKPISNKEFIAKFDHHDDTDCWALNLEDGEFKELQEVWRKNDLPENLFYYSEKKSI